MNLLLGSLAMGGILALLGLGVLITWRLCKTTDLTADGAFGLGAAVVGGLLVRGAGPLLATVAAIAAGALAGAGTALIHTRLRISALLAGVLMSTALYSMALFAMGSGNLSLVGAPVLAGPAALGVVLPVAAGCACLLALFLQTDLGLALRASGSNAPMARAVGINVDRMIVLGLSLANGLIGLSGALLAQYEGFASIQMGAGAYVTGLGGLLVGEAIVGRRPLWRWIAGVVLGATVFRLLVAMAVRLGLHPDALKLVTALLVLAALAIPQMLRPRRAGAPDG